ncbi:hypothetical protein ACQEVS_14540 [Streptomyces sp. CA-181903]|uniref:hypothetical protein n=1 Tax=Streptomyces sp. CA-181903 TaxID=3240055 RepID=UPI003D8CE8F3
MTDQNNLAHVPPAPQDEHVGTPATVTASVTATGDKGKGAPVVVQDEHVGSEPV